MDSVVPGTSDGARRHPASGTLARTLLAIALLGLVLAGLSRPVAIAEGEGELVAVVYFRKDQAGLDVTALRELDGALARLEGATEVRVDGYVQRAVRGFGRARGLSRQRADAVERHLEREARQRGWDLTITARGRGQPLFAPGAPEARRVEVYVTARG